ncbi:MAG TPA: alkaline phosphatase family protein [Thermoanaerobaculia bacterium]|nr:alkaline phosphatase family protein [Thermoanaerobaculia bacterium]
MNRPLARLLPYIALCLAACTNPASLAPKVAPPQAAAPRLVASAVADRVVLMSFDGLAADAITESRGTLSPDGFARVAAEGTFVQRIIPVNPTVTAATHVSMITGAAPEVTGIVANKFHLPGTPLDQVADGFYTGFTTETLLQAARRQGKRTGSLDFPTVDDATPQRGADWGLIYTKPLAAGRVIDLTRGDFRAEWLPPGWNASARPRHPSFSPIVRARLVWALPQDRAHQDVDLVAYDTTDDHVVNYDLLVVEIAGTETPTDTKGWFRVAVRVEAAGASSLYGSWSKLLRTDPSLEHVTVYMGSIARTEGFPESFRRMIEDEAGFWPSPPDEISFRERLSGRPGIDAETFSEQLDRFSQYLTDTTLLAIRRMPFDLLLAYQPILDQANHQFHSVPAGSREPLAEAQAASDQVRRRALAAFDRAVASVGATLDPARDALVITGDHGFSTIDTEVRLNRILVDRGFAKEQNGRLAEESHFAAYAGGSVALIYRFGGAGAAEEEQVIKMLTDLRAPDGSAVFESVERRTARTHPNNGDIVAYAFPRFALSSALGDAFIKPLYSGQHGGLNQHPELHTVLAARGRGVQRKTLPEARQTEIARYVSSLLGIAPPDGAE